MEVYDDFEIKKEPQEQVLKLWLSPRKNSGGGGKSQWIFCLRAVVFCFPFSYFFFGKFKEEKR